MKKLVIVFVLFLQFSASAFATEGFNITDRINTERFFIERYPALFGDKVYANGKRFARTYKDLDNDKKSKVFSMIQSLDPVLPGRVLRPLVYWSLIKRNSKKVSDVLSYYMFYKMLAVRDFIDNPTTPAASRKNALSTFQNIFGSDVDTDNLYEKLHSKIMAETKRINKISSFATLVASSKYINRDYTKLIPGVRPYALSYGGIIPGNKVDVISENVRSMKRIEWFNDRVIFKGGKIDFDSDDIKMPTKSDPNGHIVFKEDPIYKKIRNMIDESTDSVFIDIFLFGGTLGATLAEYLVDTAIQKKETNPNYKVLLLHDYATNYNMLGEMMPIFEYIKNRIDSEKEVSDTVMLIQANIQRHPAGIPFGLSSLVPKTKESFKVLESKSTYFESKIDHSKVIVVDGNTDHPQAYFGSKNWTDHSGGYYYDDAIYVTGPAAAMVQASYYRDVEAALTTDKNEQAWFYFKEDGFDNKKYQSDRASILDWFKIKKESYPMIGNDSLRIAEADVDGTIKNVRNILIDMIISAKKNIYMEQLFLYDPYINDALIKRKRQVPELDVKILADHNGNFGMNGLPNTMYIKELIDAGINVKARRTYGIPFTFPNGEEQEFHQENHRKITSVDGRILLGGSSNLNPDTLQGSFREFGAQIFNESVIASFDERFIKDWSDSEKTMGFDIENFKANIQGKELSVEISALINMLGAKLYRNKDKIEMRYQ